MMYLQAKVKSKHAHITKFIIAVNGSMAKDGLVRVRQKRKRDTKWMEIKIRNRACLSDYFHRVAASFLCNHKA